MTTEALKESESSTQGPTSETARSLDERLRALHESHTKRMAETKAEGQALERRSEGEDIRGTGNPSVPHPWLEVAGPYSMTSSLSTQN